MPNVRLEATVGVRVHLLFLLNTHSLHVRVLALLLIVDFGHEPLSQGSRAQQERVHPVEVHSSRGFVVLHHAFWCKVVIHNVPGDGSAEQSAPHHATPH